jgi:hypothetical protein
MAEQRWPDLDTVMEKARRVHRRHNGGRAAVRPGRVEILGLPVPYETVLLAEEPPTPKQSRRRRKARFAKSAFIVISATVCCSTCAMYPEARSGSRVDGWRSRS